MPVVLQMGKSKDLSEAKIAEVETLLRHSSRSQRDIASLCRVSQASVQRISKKIHSAQPTEPQRKGRSGRKKAVTKRGQRFLRNLVLENRSITYKQMQEKFQQSGPSVCERTIRRNLHEMGFRSRRPVKKPKLTEKMMKARLEWANSYKNFTLDQWNMVSTQKSHIIRKKQNFSSSLML